MPEVLESFCITSAKMQLQFTKRYEGITKMRINKFIYKTATANNFVMLLNMTNFNDIHRFVTASNGVQPYTFLSILSPTTLTLSTYLAFNNSWDWIGPPQNVNVVILESIINGDLSTFGSDISSNNPLYIEICLSTD